MHLAYLFDRPLPAKETDSEQALKTLAALARRGVKVSLILPQGPGSDAHLSPGERSAELCEYYQVEGDFETYALPNGFRRWSTGRKWQHAGRAIDFATTLKPDVLYTRNFPTLFHLKQQALPYAYETYRPWADQFPILRPAFRSALRRPQCLGAVLHSEFARSRYAAWGVDEAALQVVLNGYEPKHFTQRLSTLEARSALGLPTDRPLVVYAGHINATKGLDTVMSLAEQCPEADFLLVGSEGKGLIERMAQRHPNVTTLPWQPFDRTVTYLFAADVLLLPPSRIPLRVIGNTVLPMKLFLYLAAGRAILAPQAADTRELLTDADAPEGQANALLVPSGDTRAAALGLKRLLGDPNLARRLAEGALQTSVGLTWDARAEKIERFLSTRLSELRGDA